MFAEQQFVGAPANIFSPHDFVRFAMLEHAILMYAGFMSKRVGADDGLVRLNRKTGNA